MYRSKMLYGLNIGEASLVITKGKGIKQLHQTFSGPACRARQLKNSETMNNDALSPHVLEQSNMKKSPD